jgi:thiol-disulfide isomerase/thioredoxin
MSQRQKDQNTSPPLRDQLWAAALAAIAGFAVVAVYVSLWPADNVPIPEKAGGGSPSAVAEAGGPGGEVAERIGTRLAGFVMKKAPEPVSDFTFTDGSGNPRSLKDFRGKTVLLNLWATWCAPCRKEMPSLDRLQKELGSDKFEVVALALERGGADAARKFLDEIKAQNLKLYDDPTTRAGQALRAIGMPTTILIDAEGREIGRLPGPAEWDSGEAKKLVEAALK